jgi:glycosyltransferase involved in cell wall biosynthesis
MGRRKMKILSVSNFFSSHLGGLEIAARNLNEQFARQGHEVRWAFGQDSSQKATDVGPPSIRLIPLPSWIGIEKYFSISYPIPSIVSLARLRTEIEWADVIHLHDSLYVPSAWTAYQARQCGKPVVITQHVGHIPFSNPLFDVLVSSANHTLGRHMLSKADAVVFYSRIVQTYFNELTSLRGKEYFIVNGVDFRFFHPASSAEKSKFRQRWGIPGAKRVVLFVGRFTKKKGVHLFETLCRLFGDVVFVFIGWGPIDPAKWHCPNVRVFWKEPNETLRPFYCLADLLLLPSRGEGFPLVIQEAMACGLPCLFSSEIVSDEDPARSHYLLTELDDNSLANSLFEALNNPAKLPWLSQHVSEYAKDNWNWGRAAKEYEAVFKNVLWKRT